MKRPRKKTNNFHEHILHSSNSNITDYQAKSEPKKVQIRNAGKHLRQYNVSNKEMQR
jgi:hypothetical protein